VLPPQYYVPIDGTSPGTVNPENCLNGALGCQLQGGTRQDRKTFGDTFGFRFIMGKTVHEARGFHSSKDVDICYCNTNCEVASSWFKTGSLRLGPTRLVSSATERSNLPAQWTIEFVNQPGIIGLSRPYSDDGVLGLQENGLLKLVTDPDQTVDDDGCALSGYNSQFTSGLSNEVAASMNYLGKRQTKTPPDLQKIVFNSNSFVNTITVSTAGNLAVCYCAVTVDNMCIVASNWKLVTHMTIKGPKLNQGWSFSTNVVFRFSYEGYGLSSGDKVRIISADGKCTDNNFNPNTAAYAYTAINVKCPVPCTQVGLVDSSEPGDLSTIVLADDRYLCDTNNTNCETNDITQVEVISESVTELVFQFPHQMRTGDQITLGANLFCSVEPTDPTCTAEMLSSLKGVFAYSDAASNSGTAPDSYISALRFIETSNPLRGRIQVGWPAPAPKFTVIYAGARPEIGYIGRGGRWTHHSRGITREEVMATEERANLRVCWQYGGQGAKYVEEIGKLTIRNPSAMVGATLSMSTTAREARAPMVITFTTAGGVTGMRYEQAQDSLRLKIVFTRTDLVDIVYTGLEGKDIPYETPLEDDTWEASQVICGKLFSELWSADMERGFPMPKGCYYKGFTGGNRREIFMLFEPKSGLRTNTMYQLVFNGIVRENNDPPTPDEVVKGGQFMELFPMDDVTSRPYEAIERGIVSFTSIPQKPTKPNSADPQFSPDGFKIVGGFQDLLEIKSGSSITAEIMGHPTTGKIKKSNIIRVFLWPLTQWQTTSSCTAECVGGAEISFKCGQITSCLGLPAVPGMALNILKITLPEEWEGEGLYGNKKIRIKIGGITIPSGGFFAQRLGASVSDSGDSFPNYVVSAGNYIWKEPNYGIPSAKVVSQLGGGNTKPFRGDNINVLYAKLILASTIYARDVDGDDASFTITLPEGYVCLDTSASAFPGEIGPMFSNAWAAPSDLPAFGTTVPQGKGTLSDGSKTHGWSAVGNKCIYTPLHPGGVVYAGSSLVVKITANNPSFALQRSSMNNKWTTEYSNKGLHSVKQTTVKYQFASPPDPYYQTNNAVFGIITDASCQPQTMTASTKRAVNQELYFYFRTEQEVEAGGLIRLVAPEGFSFGQPCNASDLPAFYYATDADPADATLPLPGIVSCVSRGSDMRTAELRLQRILFGGRVFGFKIRVQNPMGYDPAQSTGWKLFTTDALDYIVDGTPMTIPFTGDDSTSWGIYQSSGFEVAISVSDMRPFNMTGQYALVSVILSRVPTGDSGFIRFRAPEGYVWSFDNAEFVYDTLGNTPPSLQSLVPPGVSKVLPSGVPVSKSGFTLIFRPGAYSDKETYGFTAAVKIPDKTPTSTSNAFYFELGFNSTLNRPAAATVEAPPVRALKNAAVDYSTTILGKENLVQFRLEIITPIPAGGGIEIVVPAGFTIDQDCELVAVLDPGAPAPPSGLQCLTFFDASLGLLGRNVLRLKAGLQGLPAAYHAFAVLTENPKATVSNYETATSCGTFICWTFDTFQYLANATHQSSGPLDLDTSAQGFDITRKMLEARIPVLTEEQRLSTGRDDRPQQPNNIIFAIKLSADSTESTSMMVRAPFGFVFEEECLSFVEVSESKTFGAGIRFPQDFAVWPVNITIARCRGSGRSAQLDLNYGTGNKLVNNLLYVFRIGMKSNPPLTPGVNRWTIQLGEEASEPIEGMTLWAFTRTQINPITTARDRTLAGTIRTQNPLKIGIRPFNSVPSGGELRVVAPSGFQFVALPSRVCNAELQELPYTALGIYFPGFVWPANDLVCLVDQYDTRKVAVKARNARPVSAGLDYVLVLSVYNPSVIESYYPTNWKFSSFAADGKSLDQSNILGFSLNQVMNLWAYTNPDPVDPSMEVRNGGTRLPAFSLKLKFPSTLEYGDKIVIISPQDFVLTNLEGRCNGFRWVNPVPESVVNDYSPLPNSQYECNSSTVTIYITEPSPVVRDWHIEFGLEITNPLRTPIFTDNFWRCTLYGAAMDFSGHPIIKSSKAFQSWDIIPQLENLKVNLLGPNTAAESMSSIGIQFTPVNNAEDIAILVNDPFGFSFQTAYTDDPVDQEIFLAMGPMCRIRMDIRKGVRKTIVLRNVKLGQNGGQTDISFTTWRGGLFQAGTWSPGIKQDERLNFRDGFRLPGLVSIRYEKLENQYHRDPLTYPEQSLWGSQMGRPAYAEFRFQLTKAAEVGHFLKIGAFPFQPTLTYFSLVESPSNVAADANSSSTVAKIVIKNQIVTTYNGQLQTRLLQPLIPFRQYEVVTSVIAPSAVAAEAVGGPIHWYIETMDNGELPTNTNDGNSREFPIVEEYGFKVEAAQSPPLASIVVTLSIKPALKSPSGIRIVAPLGFNFSGPCLVAGGDFVSACMPGKPTPFGRSTATLMIRGAGITSEARGIMIRVDTPGQTPVDKVWFVEGIDAIVDAQIGWGTAPGIDIRSMKDTSVTYPGFTGLRSRMVWRLRTQSLVQAGGWLHITMPAGFSPDCAEGSSLEPIALPESGGCLVLDQRNVLVYLNSTIGPAEYCFGFYITPPAATPIRNELSIILKDRTGAVQDAAVELPGMRILEKLRIRENLLFWTSTKPNRASVITIGFEVMETLPDLIVAPDQQISEVLIELPTGFTHLVEKLTDFQLMNEDMPLKENAWLDYFQKDRLTITMNLNRTSWTTLKSGSYGFRFSVMVPSPLPTYNVWHVSLCSPNYPGGCSRKSDPAVMATFAIPGFKLGGSVNGLSLTAAAVRPSFGSGGLVLLAVLLTLGLSMRPN